jgi:hypothetical protein
MSNPYGITLDREWTEWAADIGVSRTVAAALLLICQGCPPDEIVVRLTRGELEQVGEIVSRCPNHFPPGTFDALKSRGLAGYGQVLAQRPQECPANDGPTSANNRHISSGPGTGPIGSRFRSLRRRSQGSLLL